MKSFYIIILLFVLSINLKAQSKIYFISPKGDDHNSGLSIKDAWKTIEKVNNQTFYSGDMILFKTDEIWKGQLKPKGNGGTGLPIVIGSFGDGCKPVINIGDAEGAAIHLENQSWWEIHDIEITSGVPPKLGIGRQGIVALVEGKDAHIQHIVVKDCYIHDIWGQLGGTTEYTGYNSAGIFVGRVFKRENRSLNNSASDVLIEDNRIERVDKCGIIVSAGSNMNDIIVRKNVINNLGGDGIFVSGCYKGLIEYNNVNRSCLRSGDPDLPGGENFWPHTAAIWIARCDETVMQYNEVYNTGRQPGNGDGFAYDFDFDCRKCIFQYNYSFNNHGFLLIMNRTYDNITRYNISQNDQTHLIQMHGNVEDQNLIHNNVFYVNYSTIDIDYYCGDGTKDKTKLGANFKNNIFYATGQGRFRTVYTQGDVLDRQYNDTIKLPPPAAGTMFHHNCYFGPWKNGLPYDTEKMVVDPLFVAPGSGEIGLSSLNGYKLKFESPCINAGISISDNAKHDFYGNPVIDGALDIGVYEQIGSGAFKKE